MCLVTLWGSDCCDCDVWVLCNQMGACMGKKEKSDLALPVHDWLETFVQRFTEFWLSIVLLVLLSLLCVCICLCVCVCVCVYESVSGVCPCVCVVEILSLIEDVFSGTHN